MSDNELRQVQLKELEILKAFMTVCDRNNLKYYMVGGTLIGARRHKGFIPWDDDMDLAMPRDDYEKFLNECYLELPDNIRVSHYKYEDVYFYPMKLVNTDVKIMEKRLEASGETTFLSIDIFPIDAFPDNNMSRVIYQLKLMYHRARIGFCNIDRLRTYVKRGFVERMIIKTAQILKLNKYFKLEKELDSFDIFLKKYSKKGGRLVGDITGRYGTREFVPRSYFGESEKLEFEGIMVSAPAKSHKYLKHLYGDYMQLPPEDERHGDHIRIVE
jgi:LPS biosynthesis protein